MKWVPVNSITVIVFVFWKLNKIKSFPCTSQRRETLVLTHLSILIVLFWLQCDAVCSVSCVIHDTVRCSETLRWNPFDIASHISFEWLTEHDVPAWIKHQRSFTWLWVEQYMNTRETLTEHRTSVKANSSYFYTTETTFFWMHLHIAYIRNMHTHFFINFHVIFADG